MSSTHEERGAIRHVSASTNMPCQSRVTKASSNRRTQRHECHVVAYMSETGPYSRAHTISRFTTTVSTSTVTIANMTNNNHEHMEKTIPTKNNRLAKVSGSRTNQNTPERNDCKSMCSSLWAYKKESDVGLASRSSGTFQYLET